MFTKILYIVVVVCLAISFYKDKGKTKKALKKAWKSLENILPQFLTIILIIGMMLSLIDNETISRFLGSGSGLLGVLIALGVGSITLIPGFVAFPLAAALLNNGAGSAQIAAFISSLMMVGVVTMPMEKQMFGSKITIIRNVSAMLFSLVVAFIMGSIL
ncbi:MAG: permease [Sphaerochaetaceae bacterium]|nr:permease [Sphaerochaetaceae bacterium]MDC7238540.1 permease [Sphaerochaetaceae bacterium]MDC7248814.1 permease [Sphaerochaetaceae bacterium]